MKLLALLAASVGLAKAQDPAPGWLGYATGVGPAGSTLTYLEGKWKVGATPERSNAFYSPWFGIDTTDNLNLLQPVNPWLGTQWVIYNEYYQWSPEYNFNSDSNPVKAGDELFGSLTYNANNNTYTIFHSSSAGWSVSSNIGIQAGADGKPKTYYYIYFVYEKVARCAQYPPDGSVLFYDIYAEYDNKATDVTWTTGYVEDVCNNRATIVNSTAIEITWNTKAQDPSDDLLAKDAATPASWMRKPVA